jgi:hypothetical protein
MDPELARREILLLGAIRWTMLWEAFVRLNELDPGLPTEALAESTVDALRTLFDRGSIKFVRADLPGPSPESERHRLGRTQVAAAFREASWRAGRPAGDASFDVWFAMTRAGERELATLLGGKVASRRQKAFGRVVAGFASAVQDMVRRRHPRPDRGEDSPERFGHWLDRDDDAGLAGSGIPRRPPDRSGSGAAVATPEPELEHADDRH